MQWRLFFSTFMLIFLAELPDKTAFATFLMATQSQPVWVFLGVALAFLVQTIIAILFGSLFGAVLKAWIPLIAGALFLAFAWSAFRKNEIEEEEEEKKEVESRFGGPDTSVKRAPWKVFSNAFLVIFIAEWGDITQIATASLVAKYHAPWTLFFASVLGLWSVTAVVVFAGSKLGNMFNPKTMNRVVGVLMTVIGIYFIASFFRHGA